MPLVFPFELTDKIPHSCLLPPSEDRMIVAVWAKIEQGKLEPLWAIHDEIGGCPHCHLKLAEIVTQAHLMFHAEGIDEAWDYWRS